MDRIVSSLLIVLLLVWVPSCARTVKLELPKPVTGGVRFTLLAPEAKQVVIVGSFNGWAEGATPMQISDGTGLWSVDVPLQEGEYTFMYLVDGTRWLVPPLAEDFVTDGFGHTNGVVVVR
jgi:1,4-alpha-glucan branching enzyme